MQTVKVFWKDKFDGKAVTINESDFDAALHRVEADGPWKVAASNDTDAEAKKPKTDKPLKEDKPKTEK